MNIDKNRLFHFYKCYLHPHDHPSDNANNIIPRRSSKRLRGISRTRCRITSAHQCRYRHHANRNFSYRTSFSQNTHGFTTTAAPSVTYTSCPHVSPSLSLYDNRRQLSRRDIDFHHHRVCTPVTQRQRDRASV